jgi:hypothetical protein
MNSQNTAVPKAARDFKGDLMRSKVLILALSIVALTATVSQAGTNAYVGLFGGGASMTQTIDGPLEWGVKAEGGYNGMHIGGTAQVLLQYNLPTKKVPVYLQLGIGPLINSDAEVKPWGTFAVGAKLGKFDVLLQIPGFPVLGIRFPL